jgi:hypothetical protein
MVGLLAFAAASTAVSGVGGLIAALIAVAVVFLIVGIAMTLANKQWPR